MFPTVTSSSVDPQIRNVTSEGSFCNVNSLITPYNNDDNVPTYTGIMFEISAHTDIEILTLEFQTRYEDDDAIDLSVEVYTKSSDYMPYVTDRAVWTLVSKTKAIPVGTQASMGVIIPKQQFTPISILKGTTQSIYITMMSGSYIQFRANALMKFGENLMSTTDMSLFVGSGFSDPQFPSAGVNRTVNPMFSGIIHYRPKSCNILKDVIHHKNSSSNINAPDTHIQSLKTSVIDFPFLMNAPGFIKEIQIEMKNAIDNVINSNLLVQDGSMLKQYKDELRFTTSSQGVSMHVVEYQGECAEEWEACPKEYVVASLNFTTSKDFDPGYIKYEIYKNIDKILNATATAIASIPMESKGTSQAVAISYIGYEAIEASYSIELFLPKDLKMLKIHEDYFADVYTTFLNERMTKSGAVVLVSNVTNDGIAVRRSLRSYNHRDVQVNAKTNQTTVWIEGSILGAQLASKTTENYKFIVNDVMSTGAHDLEIKLSMAAIRPTNNDIAASYFYNAHVKSGIVTSVRKVTPMNNTDNIVATQPNDGFLSILPLQDWSILTLICILGSILFIVFILYQCIKSCCDRKKRKKQRERRRESANGSNKITPSNLTDDTKLSRRASASSENRVVGGEERARGRRNEQDNLEKMESPRKDSNNRQGHSKTQKNPLLRQISNATDTDSSSELSRNPYNHHHRSPPRKQESMTGVDYESPLTSPSRRNERLTKCSNKPVDGKFDQDNKNGEQSDSFSDYQPTKTLLTSCNVSIQPLDQSNSKYNSRKEDQGSPDDNGVHSSTRDTAGPVTASAGQTMANEPNSSRQQEIGTKMNNSNNMDRKLENKNGTDGRTNDTSNLSSPKKQTKLANQNYINGITNDSNYIPSPKKQIKPTKQNDVIGSTDDRNYIPSPKKQTTSTNQNEVNGSNHKRNYIPSPTKQIKLAIGNDMDGRIYDRNILPSPKKQTKPANQNDMNIRTDDRNYIPSLSMQSKTSNDLSQRGA